MKFFILSAYSFISLSSYLTWLHFILSLSFWNRGIRWMWAWLTTWPASLPLFMTMLKLALPNAKDIAFAIFFAAMIVAAKSLSSISIRVTEWFLGTTRQCPLLAGIMSRNPIT